MNNIVKKSFADLTREDKLKFNEELKKRFIIEFQKNDRSGIYAYTQKIMAYNSNKIEGSTLTPQQTSSLFDTGTIVGEEDVIYRAKDIEEMTGHFKMFNHMIKTFGDEISESLIKEFHYHLKTGVFEDLLNGYPVGEYKNRINFVSDIKTSNPLDVPAQMEQLVLAYNSSKKTFEDILRFHAQYEYIHPFQDGNGRTGRMILFKQSIESGEIPIIIRDSSKALYYKALHNAQIENDYSLLKDYIAKEQQNYYEHSKEFLYDYSKEMPENNKNHKNTDEPII